jgi:outer membrane translocation and assembly module TamA
VIETVDDPGNALQGYRFTTTLDLNAGLRRSDDSFTSLASDLVLYASPSLQPQVTVALRIGGAHNIGTFPFFNSSTLGGKANLRGYRSTRFAGRSSFYQNLELRAALLNFAGYYGYGTLGILGFIDNGRVWTDGETSRAWHRGYGGGVWVRYFNQLIVNATFGFSEDDRTFTLRTGFQF